MKALIICFLMMASVSFYNSNVELLGGNTVALQQYDGKKILLVNIATRGQFTQQVQELEQLYQQNKDKLVVIAFPSNSFGNLPHTHQQLQQLFVDSFAVTFPVTKACAVTGSGRQSVYDWLADSSKNGKGSIKISKDFQKVLIGTRGQVIGIYNNMVSPLDERIQAAINRNL